MCNDIIFNKANKIQDDFCQLMNNNEKNLVIK